MKERAVEFAAAVDWYSAAVVAASEPILPAKIQNMQNINFLMTQ